MFMAGQTYQWIIKDAIVFLLSTTGRVFRLRARTGDDTPARVIAHAAGCT